MKNRELVSFVRALLVQAAAEVGVTYSACYSQTGGAKLWHCRGNVDRLVSKLRRSLAAIGYEARFGRRTATEQWSFYAMPIHSPWPAFVNLLHERPPVTIFKRLPPGKYQVKVRSAIPQGPDRLLIIFDIAA